MGWETGHFERLFRSATQTQIAERHCRCRAHGLQSRAHQNSGRDAEDDGENELDCEITLLLRLKQRVRGIVRVDRDIDAGADRISRNLPAGEHACRQRLAADPDPIALECPAATNLLGNTGDRWPTFCNGWLHCPISPRQLHPIRRRAQRKLALFWTAQQLLGSFDGGGKQRRGSYDEPLKIVALLIFDEPDRKAIG
jgi:hypothetical protein